MCHGEHGLISVLLPGEGMCLREVACSLTVALISRKNPAVPLNKADPQSEVMKTWCRVELTA